MEDTKQLIKITEDFCAAIGYAPSTITTIVAGSGATLTNLKQGKDVNFRLAIYWLRWLSTNWPDGLEWPDDVMRPKPNEKMKYEFKRKAKKC
jgi:hypothetical protein